MARADEAQSLGSGISMTSTPRQATYLNVFDPTICRNLHDIGARAAKMAGFAFVRFRGSPAPTRYISPSCVLHALTRKFHEDPNEFPKFPASESCVQLVNVASA